MQASQTVALSRLVREIALELAPVALDKRIALAFEEGGAACIQGDPQMLRELVANLIDNAIRYSPPDTQVELATRVEGECNLKLFGRNQQSRQTVKHNFGALLRGDLKSRYEAYRIARETGTLNANEIRALEERNPIPDGDVYLVPANMTTLEKLQEPSPSPVVTSTPEPAPSDPSPEPSPTDQLESARRHMHLVRSTHA